MYLPIYHAGCCITSFYHHLLIQASTNLMKTLALGNYIVTCPKRKKSSFLYWKSYIHNTLLACPIWATVISWSFKLLARIWLLLARIWLLLARIWLLLALGKWASAYVAPCHVYHKHVQYFCTDGCKCMDHYYGPLTCTVDLCSKLHYVQYMYARRYKQPLCKHVKGLKTCQNCKNLRHVYM